MGYSGFSQYLDKDGLLRSIDAYASAPDSYISRIWSRCVDTTNGQEAKNPSSWRFEFNESHRIGWDVVVKSDFEGNEYKERNPIYRPPTKEEMDEFERAIMKMDIPCFECNGFPMSGCNSPEETCHECLGTGVYRDGIDGN